MSTDYRKAAPSELAEENQMKFRIDDPPFFYRSRQQAQSDRLPEHRDS
jgi:hypothetical protein